VAKSLTAWLGLALVTALAASAAAGPVYQAPLAYYLALGDSLAYGLQPGKVAAGLPPSGFRTGFVDVFAVRLWKLSPTIKVVNYGCPGESTVTFTAGGCPWVTGRHLLHDPYNGSQMSAALAFVKAHPNRVGPITITLWSNDVIALSKVCKGNLACVQARAPRALGAFATRLGSILRRLREAEPQAEIVVTGSWNDNGSQLAETNPLFQSLDSTISRAAQGARARFADIRPAFNPPGGIAKERARLCAYTFICSQGDGHPTDVGYRAIAAAVLATSGYTHRS
jgi:lysophospholipase L1-like esterase